MSLFRRKRLAAMDQRAARHSAPPEPSHIGDALWLGSTVLLGALILVLAVLGAAIFAHL